MKLSNLKKSTFVLVLLVVFGFLILGGRTRNFAQHLISELFRPKILIEGLVGQPHLINPLYADLNPVDQLLASLVYRGLIKFNQAGLPEGDLAQSWEISEDGKQYKITLKDNLYFQDGKKLTTQDIAFTYELTKLPEYQGPKKGAFDQVEIEIVNENKIQFTLTQPFAPFLETLSLGVLPKHLWQEKNIEQILHLDKNLLPVGGGILKIKKDGLVIDNQQDVKAMTFEILEGKLPAIQFKFYPDEQSLVLAYQLGEVDSLAIARSDLSQKLINWPNLQVLQKTLNTTQYILFFNYQVPEEKTEVKRVLNETTFRKALLNLISGKISHGSSLGPIPKASWAYQSDLLSPEFKPNPAAKILKDFNAPALTLSVLQKPAFLDLAKEVKKELEGAGLAIELEVLDSAAFETKIVKSKDFEIALVGQKMGVDPDQYTFWHSTQKDLPGLNLSSFSSRRVDKALEEGRKASDLEERKKFYQDFQDEMVKEVPAIFLIHPQLFYFLPKKLKAETPEHWWEAGDRFKNLTEWQFE